MNSLLHITARVEAAVASYVSVHNVADRAEWERHFEEEKVLTMQEFRRLQRNSRDLPALHPMLAALYIVLDAKGDLSDIGRGHPSINKHKYYLPSAKFPTDILHLLPPSEGHWWEHLAPSPTPPPPPPPSPPCQHLLKVTLIMGLPPEDSEDEMEVDQLEESPEPPSIHKKGKKKAAGSAATSRKCKLTSPPLCHSKKQNLYIFIKIRLKELGNSVKDASRPMCAQGGVQLDAAKLKDRYRITQYKVQKGKQPVAAYRKTLEASDLAALASRLVEGLTLYSMLSNTASPASLAPMAPDSPISPNPSATNTTATATTTAAASPSAPAAAAGAANATPVITPSLCQCLQPAQRLVPVVEAPMPSHLALSSSWQHSGVSAAQAPQEVPEHNSAERIQHLEMRLADVEKKLEVLMKGSGA
ncbi:hypothetical protein H4582DRAFT_2063483 [Lactarius indigo]|nr:hypothetical protein H4582DRAFT_2063483 [Lactarius indigo]